jgi:hypothetical protein
LTVGQQLEGLTVDTGTTPDAFDAEVLGVLTDGIAPGIDLVMVDTSSPAIDEVGGIWAGMSGSPVYSRDGRLVGAVAYGLSTTSPVAGLTPATAMYELRSTPTTAAGTVTLPTATRASLVAAGVATPTEAAAGFEALPMPVGISGTSVRSARKLDARIHGLLDFSTAFATGSVKAATPAIPVAPGSNAAVGLSYGDYTFAAIGTTTAVCDLEVLVFGHPFDFSGATTASLHGATALYVQQDLFQPFKVANPGAPIGTVTQDRLAGVLGRLGSAPAGAVVTSTMTNAGVSRTGTTTVTAPTYAADLAAYHTLVNAQRVLDTTHGVVRLTVTASGMNGDAPWTLTRRDTVADPYDLPWIAGSLVYDPLAQVMGYPRAQASVEDVQISATLTETYQRFTLDAVHVKVGRTWVALGGRTTPVVQAGTPVTLRLTLYPDRSSVPVRTTMTLPAPLRTGPATLTVTGGGNGPGDGAGENTPATLDALITRIEKAPRGDQVQAVWQARRTTTTVKQLSQFVVGGDEGEVRVVR